jgi:HD-like signal output (HDOD) protein
MPTGARLFSQSTAVPPARPLPPEDQAPLADLFARWESLAKQEDLLPPLSPLATRLLSLDVDESLATVELAKIVESDPVLTARILGLANSAAVTRTGKPIYEVMGAVIRLGAQAVFEAAFAQLAALWLRQSYQLPDKAQLHDLWLEYLLTAFCSREIAGALDEAEVKEPIAYAAGLLHDVGTLALSCAEPSLMSRFIHAGYAIGTPLYAGFVLAHSALSAALLQRWGTPAALVEVAARHHLDATLDESATIGVVFLADHLHQRILAHERSDFQHKVAAPLGCFDPATDQINAALTHLGLAGEIDAIIGRVASEGRRIEMLAAAVAS